jgi:hypothetical protein
MSQVLFDGFVKNGRLSNIDELIDVLPDEFMLGNKWHLYVEHMFVCGCSAINHAWRYKRYFNLALIEHMKNSFNAVFGDSSIDPKSKISLCAWMLSEMLEEVPERGDVHRRI